MPTYSISTITKNISEYKVILGAIIVVLGTIGSLILSVANLYFNTRISPIVNQVHAIQSKQYVLEEALLDAKLVDTRIESKVDRILLKLIPNANINYSN